MVNALKFCLANEIFNGGNLKSVKISKFCAIGHRELQLGMRYVMPGDE